MKLHRFAILLVVLLLLIQASTVLAARGFGMGPATLEVQRGIKGWVLEETLFLKYTGDSDRLVSLSSSGEIAQWISFYDVDGASPAGDIMAVSNEWTYAPITIDVPVSRSIGPATGQIHAMTQPDTEAGETVGMYSEVNVAVQVTARKSVPAGTGMVTLTPEQFDFTSMDSKVGRGSVSLRLDVQDAPGDAALDITAMRDVPDDIRDALQSLSEHNRYNIDDIAYLIGAYWVNLEPENIGETTTQLMVNRAWVDVYGVENLRICKIGRTSEVLDTIFVGYEGDSALFEAVSDGDFSHFALASVGEIAMANINWPLVGGLAGGAVPLAVMGIFLIRKRREAAS